MNLIALVSTCAIVVGLCATVPQLAAMTRARSAAGQSALGWTLAVLVNILMAYVNLAGYHAAVLAVGNVVSLALCLVALALIARYRTRAQAPAPAAVVSRAPVHELPTCEFVALRALLDDEANRREGRREARRGDQRSLAAA